MDRKDYLEKAKILLAQSTYRELTLDPTGKYKAKLVNIIKRIKKNHEWMTTCTSHVSDRGTLSQVLWPS